MNKFTIFCTATFLTFLKYFSYKINIKIYFTLDNAHRDRYWLPGYLAPVQTVPSRPVYKLLMIYDA